ncbi:hypothetical protein [Nocardia asteroides]|uniref:hypothetical protein n=1 Tax=Nocardia asteroides TaxID=1824 RepID=UPI001E3ED4B1|nr:hypothetical protein [Nocardia asteroides]UGT54991.1 hypothetical protein LTT85_31065 [Nocardia asteroides]
MAISMWDGAGEMFEPNPVQAKLLKAVQNLASDNQHLIDQSRTGDNQDLSPMALAHLDIGRRTRENLEAIATAVGVPKSVIDYTRACGERGHRWAPGQPLLSTEAIDRDTLLRGHRRAVAELQTMAGVGAAAARQGALSRAGFSAFRRVMGVSWQRVGAIGHALGLNAVEQQHAWEPTAQPWTEQVAQTMSRLDRAELSARWHAVVDTDFATVSMPVMVLQAAGITPDDINRQLPVLPDRMVELAAAALEPRPTQRAIGGGDIDAAIEATGTGAHTEHDPTDHRPGPTPDQHTGPETGPGP